MPYKLGISAETFLATLEANDPQRWRRLQRRLAWAEVSLDEAGFSRQSKQRWFHPVLHFTIVASHRDGKLTGLWAVVDDLKD